MSKVKLVQIANVGDEYPTEYLDNEGRLWFREYVKEDTDPNFGVPVRGHYEWRQIELPEEPSL